MEDIKRLNFLVKNNKEIDYNKNYIKLVSIIYFSGLGVSGLLWLIPSETNTLLL